MHANTENTFTAIMGPYLSKALGNQ